MDGIGWEYLIIQQPEALQSLGLEDWELVSVVKVDDELHHYLKRPGPNFQQRLTETQRQQIYAQYKVK